MQLIPNSLSRRLCVLLAIVVAATFAAPAALAQADQRKLVTAATVTLASFLRDPEMTWLRQNLGRARAVVIAPEITKASIIVGGSGGRAVVVVRDPTDRPLGRAGVLHARHCEHRTSGRHRRIRGGYVGHDGEGCGRLLSNSFRMGGDVAIAVGPIEAGAQSHFVADLVSFSRGQGVYLGANLDGTVVSTADDWNQLYYGQRATVVDILVRMNVHNAQAKELLNVIAMAAKNSTDARGGRQ